MDGWMDGWAGISRDCVDSALGLIGFRLGTWNSFWDGV